ncbi:MAG: sulfite exporter TauE/SafE family protein [Clostridiales bacterium]|nr:sulfite exporter TauE/SafE family protein [Clostridiales bacterium]
MQTFFYVVVGFLGGLLGGMGMGGGTLLIPLLSLCFSLVQKQAQAINLVAFLPMAIVALAVHTKNGLVQYKTALPMLLPGVVFSLFGAFFAKALPNAVLRKVFGGFLLLLAVRSFLLNKKGNKGFYAPEEKRTGEEKH